MSSTASGDGPIAYYRQHLIQEELGQFHTIGGMSQSSFGKSKDHQQQAIKRPFSEAGKWPTLCHQQCLIRGKLGQLEAIGSGAR